MRGVHARMVSTRGWRVSLPAPVPIYPSNAMPIVQHLEPIQKIDGVLKESISNARPAVVIALALTSIIALAATLQWEWAMEFSGFAYMMGKWVLGLMLWLAFDRYVLHQFDTLDELKKGNMAVALVASVAFAGICYIAANC